MESLRQYILTLISAALLCAVILTMVEDSRLKETIKFICGVFFTITALTPLVRVDLSQIMTFSNLHAYDAEEVISSGQKYADSSAYEFIKSECEAYILDKANELAANIYADVTLSSAEPFIPVSVTISGKVTPYIRLQLEELIQQDLGISKENQIWTG